MGKKCKGKNIDPDDPACYIQNDIVMRTTRWMIMEMGCIEPSECTNLTTGTIDCDLDDDGINDLMAGGDAELAGLWNGGGGGANELKNWLTNGFPDPISNRIPGCPSKAVFRQVFSTLRPLLWLAKMWLFQCLTRSAQLCPIDLSQAALKLWTHADYETLDDRSYKQATEKNFTISTRLPIFM